MKFVDWIDSALVAIAAFALTFIMLMTTVSVMGRYFFNAPVPDDTAINEILLVFVVFLPLSYVQAKREHIFVSVFSEWMSSNTKVVLDIFGTVVGAVIFSVIAWAVFTDFQHALMTAEFVDSALRLPTWPGKLVVASGIALFSLRLIIDSVAMSAALVKGTAVPAEEQREADK